MTSPTAACTWHVAFLPLLVLRPKYSGELDPYGGCWCHCFTRSSGVMVLIMLNEKGPPLPQPWPLSNTVWLMAVQDNGAYWSCYRKIWQSIEPGAGSRFAPSQWETALLCNDVSHWLDASLESALEPTRLGVEYVHIALEFCGRRTLYWHGPQFLQELRFFLLFIIGGTPENRNNNDNYSLKNNIFYRC